MGVRKPTEEIIRPYVVNGKTKYLIDTSINLAEGKFFRYRVRGFSTKEEAEICYANLAKRIEKATGDKQEADALIRDSRKIKKFSRKKNKNLRQVWEDIQRYIQKNKTVSHETLKTYCWEFERTFAEYEEIIFSQMKKETIDEIFFNYRKKALFQIIMKYAGILKMDLPDFSPYWYRDAGGSKRGRHKNEGKSLFEIFGG